MKVISAILRFLRAPRSAARGAPEMADKDAYGAHEGGAALAVQQGVRTMRIMRPYLPSTSTSASSRPHACPCAPRAAGEGDAGPGPPCEALSHPDCLDRIFEFVGGREELVTTLPLVGAARSCPWGQCSVCAHAWPPRTL